MTLIKWWMLRFTRKPCRTNITLQKIKFETSSHGNNGQSGIDEGRSVASWHRCDYEKFSNCTKYCDYRFNVKNSSKWHIYGCIIISTYAYASSNIIGFIQSTEWNGIKEIESEKMKANFSHSIQSNRLYHVCHAGTKVNPPIVAAISRTCTKKIHLIIVHGHLNS